MVTALYAGILGLFLFVLSVRVIKVRRAENRGFGHDVKTPLERKVRAQANFAEYAPICLVIMAVAELSGLPAWALHFCGLNLLVGRFIHGAGLSFMDDWKVGRVLGMVLTFNGILGASIGALTMWVLKSF